MTKIVVAPAPTRPSERTTKVWWGRFRETLMKLHCYSQVVKRQTIMTKPVSSSSSLIVLVSKSQFWFSPFMAISSSCNWVFDVFPSFSGEDVRRTFLSHLLLSLDHKLITCFKDNEIERSQSIGLKLVHAIRDSRIAIVVFSKTYASSTWCLNELLEIVKCKEDKGQIVIPVFYGLDPSHVRKQTGEFGETFQMICKNRSDELPDLWKGALTHVANIHGYHSDNWYILLHFLILV